MTDFRTDPDALDRAVDAVLAGDPSAMPLAAAVRDALESEVGAQARTSHLAAIAAVSPERSPEPDPRVADITPITTARSRRGGRRALVAAIAAVMLLTLGSSTALAASTNANPGDPLYGVKRASERVAIALRRSPESKAVLHLRFAERRLDEIEALAAAGRDVDALAEDFAGELEAAAISGSDKILEKIRARTQKHIEHLNEILLRAPDEARDGLETAIENARRNGERAEQRRIEKAEKKDGSSPGGESPPGKDKAPGRSSDKPGKGKSK